MKHGKDFSFGLHVLPRAIMLYHMNRYKLSWVILSFTEWWIRLRKVLVIYRSFSFAYPLSASLKMSGMSMTYSGYWYPPSPDNSPHNKNPKSPQWAYPSQMVYPSNAPIQKLYHYGVWIIFLTKKLEQKQFKKNRERQDPYHHSRELK